MTDEQLLRERDELMTDTNNYRERLRAVADELIEGGHTDAAGIALLLDRLVSIKANDLACLMVPDQSERIAAAAAPVKRGDRKRAPAGHGAHRHKFGPDGRCECGAQRQRAPRGAAGSPEARTPALPGVTAPRPLRSADEFQDGTMGSSGARR